MSIVFNSLTHEPFYVKGIKEDSLFKKMTSIVSRVKGQGHNHWKSMKFICLKSAYSWESSKFKKNSQRLNPFTSSTQNRRSANWAIEAVSISTYFSVDIMCFKDKWPWPFDLFVAVNMLILFVIIKMFSSISGISKYLFLYLITKLQFCTAIGCLIVL